MNIGIEETIITIIRERENKNMGLEKHVDRILSEAKLAGSYFWCNGLSTSEKDAKKIMKVLDDTEEFGPTRYNKKTGRIEFGVVEEFYTGSDYNNYSKDFKNWIVDSEGQRMEIFKMNQLVLSRFECAGFPFARVISSSKSSYSNQFPDHRIVFNARIYDLETYEREKDGSIQDWFAGQSIEIWYGDIDLTKDIKKLKEIAKEIGPFVITTESGSYVTTIEKEKNGNYNR